jgi:hypothetical protein
VTEPSLNAAADLAAGGFAFLSSAGTGTWLAQSGSLTDWDAFADSWNGMARDSYMADGGRYRRRRHAAFVADAQGIRRAAHQPHYQARTYNQLNGGIARWFEPTPASIAAGPSFQTVLAACHQLFGALRPGCRWHVETHQFRIEARPDEAGQPTPEGSHRDGVDFVLVLLIRRANIARGVTTIHAPDGTDLGSFTLEHPLEAALVDDHRVFHGVTAVEPIDPALPAYRDVLVVTFRAMQGAAAM